MKPKVVVAIDPGLKGAVAVLGLTHEGADLVQVCDTPTKELFQSGKAQTDYDLPAMRDLLQNFQAEYSVVIVVIERVAFMPGQNCVATGRSGLGYGVWLGLLTALGLPYTSVPAATWKKAIFQGTGLTIPPGSGLSPTKRKTLLKNNSRELARRLYPAQQALFAASKDNDRAEALLLARYQALQPAP